MQTGKEIKANTINIKYYLNEIKKSSAKQFELDANLPEMNASAGAIRFDALAIIASHCEYIGTYISAIENLVIIAEKQDKVLLTEETNLTSEY